MDSCQLMCVHVHVCAGVHVGVGKAAQDEALMEKGLAGISTHLSKAKGEHRGWPGVKGLSSSGI